MIPPKRVLQADDRLLPAKEEKQHDPSPSPVPVPPKSPSLPRGGPPEGATSVGNARLSHAVTRGSIASVKNGCSAGRGEGSKKTSRQCVRKAVSLLGPGDLHAQFFRQAFANLLRQAVMHATRTFLGRIEHRDRHGR